ncbi:subtilisin-like protease SBT3.4 isoform X1 [Solanum stenotomum]|uniref:subtilisin-like protease SBT3.4 isoform X1 n=1 Tax=Solanum stenotomum TaxID=172797 RepID=UPI0020D05F7F|nr:subtilisin-like protease SBT3.4 isoform X1 [Solanum stenotomum]
MDINLQQLCLCLTSHIYHIMSISHFLQYKLAFTVLLLFLNLSDFLGIQANTESKVHIVYMGRRQHDDIELITSAHHQILTFVLGSPEAARDSIIYSYKHGFSGFAARLTKSQAKKIAELPDVVHVIPNHLYKLHTTRSWDYLGLSTSSPPTNLFHEANMGDGVIIGVLDTGIWPESEAFNDKGLGPIPSKWKGHCQSGTDFDPAKACNKKLIGAKYFLKGFEAELGRQFLKNEFASPRDGNGHGTHTSSTAAGSFAPNASYHGLAYGTVRGGAPKARIAMYKVCWDSGVCNSADIIKGIDEAINDGVDVLSISIGLTTPQYADVDMRNGIAFASYHAVGRGITVVCSGGNEGPIAQTVDDTSPWIITVAASSIDRSFPTLITLGNNRTFVGQSLYTGKETNFINIVYPERKCYCDKLNANDTWATGNVVLCFLVQGDDLLLSTTQEVLQEVGGLGLIVAKNPTTDLNIYASDFPSIGVSFDVGAQLLDYIRYARKPQVKLSAPKTHVGIPVSTHIASFSSRGPNSVAPAILKPDIAAPGVNILAAVPPEETPYEFDSGTSMAAPHISGIAALLKSLHPHWSPAAIKSALVTTAWQTDPHSGEPIIAKGNTDKIADPFDFGGGLVNANGANDPGLVYDMGESDYVFNYLCPMGYNTSAISRITNRFVTCANKMPSILDFNLPSLTIPSLKKTVTVKRTVTNVGPVNSQYKAIIEPPLGITIKVMPEALIFNSSIEKISFTLTISTTHKYNTGYNFGSLTWTDGVHRVRSPISVRTEFPELAG